MKVSAVVDVMRDFGTGNEWLQVWLEAQATWDKAANDVQWSAPKVLAWDGEGEAPRWDDLDEREQRMAWDRLAVAASWEAIRAEAFPLPYALDEAA